MAFVEIVGEQRYEPVERRLVHRGADLIVFSQRRRHITTYRHQLSPLAEALGYPAPIVHLLAGALLFLLGSAPLNLTHGTSPLGWGLVAAGLGLGAWGLGVVALLDRATPPLPAPRAQVAAGVWLVRFERARGVRLVGPVEGGGALETADAPLVAALAPGRVKLALDEPRGSPYADLYEQPPWDHDDVDDRCLTDVGLKVIGVRPVREPEPPDLHGHFWVEAADHTDEARRARLLDTKRALQAFIDG